MLLCHLQSPPPREGEAQAGRTGQDRTEGKWQAAQRAERQGWQHSSCPEAFYFWRHRHHVAEALNRLFSPF